MKKLLLVSVIIFIISGGAAANQIKLYPGAVEGTNIANPVFGGQVTLATDFPSAHFGEQQEINFIFTANDEDYNVYNLDVMLYNQIDTLPAHNYVGLGVKRLFFAAANAEEVEGYTIPLSLKAKEQINKRLEFTLAGSIFPLGLYRVKRPEEEENINSRFDGYQWELKAGINLTSNLQLQLGYRQEDYTFKADDEISDSEKFTTDYQLLYLGTDIKW